MDGTWTICGTMLVSNIAAVSIDIPNQLIKITDMMRLLFKNFDVVGHATLQLFSRAPNLPLVPVTEPLDI